MLLIRFDVVVVRANAWIVDSAEIKNEKKKIKWSKFPFCVFEMRGVVVVFIYYFTGGIPVNKNKKQNPQQQQ